MGRDVIERVHLSGVSALLDQLQTGFILIGPAGEIQEYNYWARRVFSRQILAGNASDWLGIDVFDDLVQPVLNGDKDGARWRELSLTGRGDVVIEVSMRTTAVLFEDGSIGALVSMHDISGEVGLHRQNKELLERQKEINEELRREITAQLRAHEDDLAQFAEILQLAPAVFSSFVAESEEALSTVQGVVAKGANDDRVNEALRALHTLKGNARSFGLNHIGGRAHGVEELLLAVRDLGEKIPAAHLRTLRELTDDLRRATERASFVRSHLAATSGSDASNIDIERYLQLEDLAGQLAILAASMPEGTDEKRRAEEARASAQRLSSLPLQDFFEYLRATVAQTARSIKTDCPTVESSGGNIKVRPHLYKMLSAAIPHLARNAVTHGLESAEERLALGKSATGNISIAARRDGKALVVDIVDDGRGLDVAKLRAAAEERGLPPPDTPETLAAAVLAPGLSTADEVDLDSGRGMGTSAAAEAVAEVGGQITVETSRGTGTRFSLRVPDAF